ncbi:MAG: hypothetical protein ABI145_15395 [Steroidobacteraceae bacterium]
METVKRCPYCAEEILGAAIKCKHCSADLAADTSIAPIVSKRKRWWSRPISPWVACAVIATGYLGVSAKDWIVRTDSVGEDAKRVMQSNFDSEPDLKPYHLSVSKVAVVHADGNNYAGVATVLMDGKEHSVGLKIQDDGRTIIYKADSDAFLFLVESALSKNSGN